MARISAALTVFLLFSVCVGKDKPFNPYGSGPLPGNYNPQQADFSKEYLDLRLQSEDIVSRKNELPQSLDYDYSSVWLTKNGRQNGVIGSNYQRIEIHIGGVTRSKDRADVYLVTGKSKVNGNICDFSGEIRLIKLFYKDCYEDSDPNAPTSAGGPKCARLFARYEFYEDSSQSHTGVFKGVTECDVTTDKTKMVLDESTDFSDGYFNRVFVGTWADYKIKKPKKCIWSDYRIPFAFGFDCGDGEMFVCKEYENNGWQTFNDASEHICAGGDAPCELKDKWWIKKTKK